MKQQLFKICNFFGTRNPNFQTIFAGLTTKIGEGSEMPHDHEYTRDEIEALAQRAIQDIDPSEIGSPALKRLIQDVRGEPEGAAAMPSAYNRMHNRHNRGR